MERVLTVSVLHLLAADGPYAAGVADLLDQSEVWAAYRDQRHDLFLPAGDSSRVSLHFGVVSQCAAEILSISFPLFPRDVSSP